MQQEFEYVYEIYRAGSFTKAAEKLHITQPALSMAVKRIESSIGMALFDRSARPLEPTEAGKIFLEAVLRIMADEEDMKAQIRDIEELKSGSLCVGGSHYINTCILPEAMTEYSRLYPAINLELIEASSAVLAEMLNDRQIDLTFSCREDIIAEFQHYPAFNDHIILAAAPEILDLPCAMRADEILSGRHLLNDCPSVPFNNMKELEYIILSEGNNLHDRAARIFTEAGIQPKIKLEISQLSTSYHLAKAKFGAAFISDRMVQAGEEALRFYKIDSSVTEREFFAVLPKREYTPKAVRAFIDLFRRNYVF
ncbi:MAG: LysR family transcriptional regulator [Synergistaceae bacterium]|nr:LysR family transcriptional regulator [Synergistaceae bacterium]